MTRNSKKSGGNANKNSTYGENDPPRRITRRRNAEEKAALGRGASIPFRYQLKPAQEPKRHRLLGSYAALRRRKSRLRQEYKGGRHIAEDLRA